MTNKSDRFSDLSRETSVGLQLVAAEIQLARKSRRMTETELAERVGCSRDTIRAIEAGRPSVAIGHVFEAAAMVGLDLFGGAEAARDQNGPAMSSLPLLTDRYRHSRVDFDSDDF